MVQKKIFRICGLVSGVSGAIILFSALYPIISYEIDSRVNYPELISPVVRNKVLLDGSLLDSRDLTKASNWFDGGVAENDFSDNSIQHYTITIPKLGIENAVVAIGGEDLADSLIQYPKTALPGTKGNSVVFGHSILPIFYDPQNYLAIFSTLNKLTKDDEVYLTYDGVKYQYKIVDKFEVKPTDIQILDQDEYGSFLSLVTCTPPGHPAKPKRLVVRAEIVSNISSR
jgi:sortase A